MGASPKTAESSPRCGEARRASLGTGQWLGRPWVEECWQIPEAGCDWGTGVYVPSPPLPCQVLLQGSQAGDGGGGHRDQQGWGKKVPLMTQLVFKGN